MSRAIDERLASVTAHAIAGGRSLKQQVVIGGAGAAFLALSSPERKVQRGVRRTGQVGDAGRDRSAGERAVCGTQQGGSTPLR